MKIGNQLLLSNTSQEHFNSFDDIILMGLLLHKITETSFSTLSTMNNNNNN